MGAVFEAAAANAQGETALVISGVDGDEDAVFGCDLGYWNVSRIQRDADAGVFGPPKAMLTRPALLVNETVEVDPAKVIGFYKAGVTDQYYPLLAVLWKGVLVLVDGQHRLRSCALHRREHFRCFVVPEEAEGRYRVRFFEQAPGGNPVEIPAAEMERRRAERAGEAGA